MLVLLFPPAGLPKTCRGLSVCSWREGAERKTKVQRCVGLYWRTNVPGLTACWTNVLEVYTILLFSVLLCGCCVVTRLNLKPYFDTLHTRTPGAPYLHTTHLIAFQLCVITSGFECKKGSRSGIYSWAVATTIFAVVRRLKVWVEWYLYL